MGFIKDIVKGETGTQAVLNNYNVHSQGGKSNKEVIAANIANELLEKPSIIEAIEKFADKIPEEKLLTVLKEGLDAGKSIYKNNNSTGEVEEVGYEADYAVRHKYLDTGLKLKGFYPKEGNQTNVQVNINRFKEYE